MESATSPLLNNEEAETSPVLEIRSASMRTKWIIVVSCFYCNLVAGMILALQAPFFPKECDRKGIPATTYGFIFGIYDLVLLIVSVPVGVNIHKVGVKYCFLIGIFTVASSTVLFGTLSYVSNKTIFVTYAFLIRIIEALGAACINNACLTVTTTIIPEKSYTLGAWAEGCFGVGNFLGPSLGGVLFDLGGFSFPFWIVGGMSIFGMLPIITFLPSQQQGDTENKEEISLWSLTKEGRMWCGVVTMALSSGASLGFLDVTLEPHLRQITSSGTIAGIVFFLSALGYSTLMPLWGKLVDKNIAPGKLMIFATFLIILGLSISGPFPWLPFQPQLSTISIGAFVTGVGMGGVFVPLLKYMTLIVLGLGFQDNDEVAGAVSGIWLSSMSLGCFVGPSLSGILFDNFGFRIASFFMIVVHLLVIVLVAGFELKDRKKNSRALNGADTQSLLE